MTRRTAALATVGLVVAGSALALVETTALTWTAAVGAAALVVSQAADLRLGRRAGWIQPAAEPRKLGRWRLVERLGQGGMGEVWRAEHESLGRQAAVKLVTLDPVATPARRREQLTRFDREARSMARLRSPHTVGVFDHGTTPCGRRWYAMELLRGLDLGQLVQRHGPVPPARAAALLRQACASLAEAHEAGLVHRDVKPANLFLTASDGLDHVKVIDFGLVTSAGAWPGFGGGRITAQDVVVGTPSGMAPEMIEGRPVDGRADVYALGCVAYWLLTGSELFATEGKSPLQVMVDHARTAPERPSSRLGRPLPRGLEELVLECVAKEPHRRPQGAREVARRLEALDLAGWSDADARRWWAEAQAATRPRRAA